MAIAWDHHLADDAELQGAAHARSPGRRSAHLGGHGVDSQLGAVSRRAESDHRRGDPRSRRGRGGGDGREASPPTHVHEMAPGTAAPSFARLDKFVQVVRMDGQVIARSMTLGSARLPTKPGLLTRLQEGETVFETVDDFGEEPVRMVSLPVEVGGTRYAVQVAMSLDDAYAVLRSARLLFTGMAASILVGVGLIGVVLTRRALRPIDRIVSRAREIGEGSLSERLPRPAQQDEIGRLVDTLNEMLGRIQESFEIQRRRSEEHTSELQSRFDLVCRLLLEKKKKKKQKKRNLEIKYI